MRLPARREERPLADVPRRVGLALALALALQAGVHLALPGPASVVRALPPPPDAARLRLLAMGEPVAASRLAMLWLQAFDNQPGVSLPLRALDYARLRGWLEAILALDPASSYPLLSAARLYGEFALPAQQRQMLDFVHQAFLEAPAQRWQWLAHAVYIARHRLQDQPLALHYARAIAEHTGPGQAPSWARQMHIFVLEDMGRDEAAKVLLGGLLASGEVTDPGELAFLQARLAALAAAAAAEE